jgi:hypothetical protein
MHVFMRACVVRSRVLLMHAVQGMCLAFGSQACRDVSCKLQSHKAADRTGINTHDAQAASAMHN